MRQVGHLLKFFYLFGSKIFKIIFDLLNLCSFVRANHQFSKTCKLSNIIASSYSLLMSGYRLGMPCLYLSSKCNFVILHLYVVETLRMKGTLTVLKAFTFGLIETSVVYRLYITWWRFTEL